MDRREHQEAQRTEPVEAQVPVVSALPANAEGAEGEPSAAFFAQEAAAEAPPLPGTDAAHVAATSATEDTSASPAEPLVSAVDDPEALLEAIAQGAGQLGQMAEEAAPEVMDLHPQELRGVVEALLLVATKPMKLELMQKCLPGAQADYLRGFLHGLSERFTRERRGFDLREVAGGWQLLTRADFHPWVRRLSKKELPSRLGRSALETLAIVAYKQPVTRGAIEDIRGVQCGPMLRQLMDLKLVQVVGRDDQLLGRPLLYGTSEDFLQRFGLGSLADLPRAHELGA